MFGEFNFESPDDGWLQQVQQQIAAYQAQQGASQASIGLLNAPQKVTQDIKQLSPVQMAPSAAPGGLLGTIPFNPYAQQQSYAANREKDAYGNPIEGMVDPSQYLDQSALAKLGWTGGNGYDANQSAMSQDQVRSLQDNQQFTDFLGQNKYSLGGGMMPGASKAEGYLTDQSGNQLARGQYDWSGQDNLFMAAAAAALGGVAGPSVLGGAEAAGESAALGMDQVGAMSGAAGDVAPAAFNAAADSQAASLAAGYAPASMGAGVTAPAVAYGVGGVPTLAEVAAGSAAGGSAQPAVFNAAADSQAASAAAGYNPATMATGTPSTVNLGSLGGTTATTGGLQGAFDVAKQAGGDMLGSAGSTASDAAAWAKANPMLARLLMSGAGGLLGGLGGQSGSIAGMGGQGYGPAKQWTAPSSVDTSLLAPAQRQLPPQRQQPMGLLNVSGSPNSGAWRYLKGG